MKDCAPEEKQKKGVPERKRTGTAFCNPGLVEMKGTPGSHRVQLPAKNTISSVTLVTDGD